MPFLKGAYRTMSTTGREETMIESENRNSVRSRGIRAGRWALGGALWGALSFAVRGFLPDLYFDLLGYTLGRALQWLMPGWWAARIDQGLGILWLGSHLAAFFVASVLLGAGAGLGLWWLLERLRSVLSTNRIVRF